MPRSENIAELEARQGEKMIEVKIRFWTNDLAAEGRIRPKHAWGSGVVRLERNHSHGITPGQPIVFQSLLDLGSAIEKALIANEVVLHPSRRMRKYMEPSPAQTEALTPLA